MHLYINSTLVLMCIPLSCTKAGAEATVKVTLPTLFLARHTYSPSNPATKFDITRPSDEMIRPGSFSLTSAPLWVNKRGKLLFWTSHLRLMMSPTVKIPPRGWTFMVGRNDTSLMPWPSAEKRERERERNRVMYKWIRNQRQRKPKLIHWDVQCDKEYIN